MPRRFLPTLVTLPAMWNHYAAAISHSRLPYELLATKRGIRYTGNSKMNYLSLVMHGLHAISVFSDLVAVRILVATFALSFGCGAVLAGIWIARLYAELPMPGQLSFWDRFMIPISRMIDPVIRYRLGKSVVCVWESNKIFNRVR